MKSRFAEEQIEHALKRVVLRTKVEELCRKVGISEATFYAWKRKYGEPTLLFSLSIASKQRFSLRYA
jgi:putative transposase